MPQEADEILSDTFSSGVASPAACHTGKVRLAVYDFDGTCISGNSPVMLVFHLLKDGLLSFPQGLRIGGWALRYKFQLPQNESLVRGLVFKPFCGQPKDLVDEYLRLFYDEVVAPLWRPAASESMRAHAAEGCEVMVVSATWEAIVLRAQENHPFTHVAATKMTTDALGNYTCRVEGLPVEGTEKLHAIQTLADSLYGKGGWELAYAYGDHHSDIPLLSAAQHACAVTPDKPLGRAARKRNWPILDWE